MTRVFIVDDHPIVRQGLRNLIQGVPGLTVVGEADSFSGAATQITSLLPDVVILDLNLGAGPGVELIRLCRGLQPAPAPVVLTMHREASIFDAALSLGAAAYVLKENTSDEVLLAIRAVARGGFFLSGSLKEFLNRRNAHGTAECVPPHLAALTPTERRVLRLIGSNRTTKEIARELCVSPRTVDTHRAHICERLNLHGAQALLRFALEKRAEL